MSHTCALDTLDLGSGLNGITLETADLPSAKLTDFGRSAQRAGARPVEAHYAEAPYLLTLALRDADVDSLIADVTDAAHVGARLTFGVTTVRWCPVTSAEVEVVDKDDGWAKLSVFGFRAPAWRGGPETVVAYTGTVTGGWGWVDIDLSTLAGDMGAEVSMRATCASASTMIAVGVVPSPGANHDPLDDYSGVADGTAVGGAWSAASGSLTATYQDVASAPSVDVEANRGESLVVARLKHTAVTPGNVRYLIANTAPGGTSLTPPVAATAATNTAEAVVFGVLRLPAFETPGLNAINTSGSVRTWNGTPETPYGVPRQADGKVRFAQTFTAPATGDVTGIRVDNASDCDIISAKIYATSAGVPTTVVGDLSAAGNLNAQSGFLRARTPVHVTSGTVYAVVLVASDGVKYLATMAIRTSPTSAYSGGQAFVRNAGDTAWVQGDGTNANTDWTLTVEFVTTKSTTNTVQASCSESTKTASLDALVRIPASCYLLARGTFGAGAGAVYDPGTRAAYLGDANGITGAMLSHVSQGLALWPRTVNRVVTACSAVANVTVAGTATPLFVDAG